MKFRSCAAAGSNPRTMRLAFQPVVIDTDLAKALFGDDDPIGKKFDPESGRRACASSASSRRSARTASSSSDNVNMVFRRVSLRAAKDVDAARHHHPRPSRNAGGVRGELISRRTHEIFPNYEQRVRRMEAMRTFAMRLYLIPVAAGSVIAAFLISMVALGLSGVLWQNVTRRTREIGLRRALGATGNEVQSPDPARGGAAGDARADRRRDRRRATAAPRHLHAGQPARRSRSAWPARLRPSTASRYCAACIRAGSPDASNLPQALHYE